MPDPALSIAVSCFHFALLFSLRKISQRQPLLQLQVTQVHIPGLPNQMDLLWNPEAPSCYVAGLVTLSALVPHWKTGKY